MGSSEIEGLFALGGVWKEQIFEALTLVADEARPERIDSLVEAISEIRERIERRMSLRKTLERKLDRIEFVREELERKCDTTNTVVALILSLMTEHVLALKQRIGELRPNSDLKKKSELQFVVDGLLSRRRAAQTLQQSIKELLNG